MTGSANDQALGDTSAGEQSSSVTAFQAPEKLFNALNSDTATSLIAAAADLALVVDKSGIIRDLACSSHELSASAQDFSQWLGKPWAETVTVESRPKIEALLRDATSARATRRRHVNHPSKQGQDLPITYSAVKIGNKGQIVAVGRDLSAIAVLQQRLVELQQSMERDYSRLRHAETRYRLLFQMASEAVLIVDAGSQKILEANPAAIQLLGETVKRGVIGRGFPNGFFSADGSKAITALLDKARKSGRAGDIQIRAANDSSSPFTVSASLFRQDNTPIFLVRLTPTRAADADGSTGVDEAATVVPKAKSKLLEVIDSAPEGFVVTNPEGTILTANRGFLDLVQLVSEDQALGESIDNWLGRPGVDLSILLNNLRQHGSVRLFSTTLRDVHGSTVEVEISAVSVLDGDLPCFGFMIRNIRQSSRGALMNSVRGDRELPRSVEQLTELVGRVSLKELVRETTDVIERLCIEAALELTGDNRASAAEMLGLSRQSLYVKLRRHGLGDLDSDNH